MSNDTSPRHRRDGRRGPADDLRRRGETTEGSVYTVTGSDWDTSSTASPAARQERVVVNMGPQHPSTHGVLRLILELDGETVTEAASASATCTPASRRTSSTAPGRRASRS